VSAFAALVALAALLTLPELYSSILRSRPVGSLSGLVCSDGVDNDHDGKTDYPGDLGCSSPQDRTEKEPACADRLDNDADGKTDYPDDASCSSPNDPSEEVAGCADGRDNDGDGETDYPYDLGCGSPADESEEQ
jgi:hypothetical protein